VSLLARDASAFVNAPLSGMRESNAALSMFSKKKGSASKSKKAPASFNEADRDVALEGRFIRPVSVSELVNGDFSDPNYMSDNGDRSIALPFDKYPPGLDGTLAGDYGFDPAGFTNNLPRQWLIGGEERSLKWYREAEITHARVAMLATLGWIFPEIAHFGGNAQVGQDAFAELNPLKAIYTAPAAGLVQIAFGIFALEYFRIKRVIQGDAAAGDLGLGQGEGRWNPFKFNYSPEEYKTMQTREIKNGRLAMIGILAMIAQANASGEGLLTQLGQKAVGVSVVDLLEA